MLALVLEFFFFFGFWFLLLVLVLLEPQAERDEKNRGLSFGGGQTERVSSVKRVSSGPRMGWSSVVWVERGFASGRPECGLRLRVNHHFKGQDT